MADTVGILNNKSNDNNMKEEFFTKNAVTVDSDKIIDNLEKKANEIIEGKDKKNEENFRFNKNTAVKYDTKMYIKAARLKEDIRLRNFFVSFEENLDIKKIELNKNTNSKYMIRISDCNGCYVEFSYFEYREIVEDFMQSERDYIYNCLIKMSGSDNTFDKNSKQCSVLEETAEKICKYISMLCYFKELQTKVYGTIGWDEYDNELIFKYDKIYRYNSLIDKSKIDKLKKIEELGINEADLVDDEDDTINNETIKKYFRKDISSLNEYLFDLHVKREKSRCTIDIADALSCDDNIDESADINVLYDVAAWSQYLAFIMNYSTKGALIIAAAATGLIRQLLPYTKENNINMNIVGKPAHGKSIICHFALSLFGDPSELEGSFMDSDVAMELNRVKRPVIPYILDERMLKIEESSEKAKRQKVLMDIFREYEGKAKEKTAGIGANMSGMRTFAPIISSSVDSMLDLILKINRDVGQYRRFIEINLDDKKDLFKNAKMAEATEEMAYSYYGYGIKLLVPYILRKMEETENNKVENVENVEDAENKKAEEKNYVLKLYDKITGDISSKLGEVEKQHGLKGLKSSAKRFSLIITTLKIIIDAIKDINDTEIKLNDKLINNVYDLLEENLVDKFSKITIKDFDPALSNNLSAFINRFKDSDIFKTDGIVAWRPESMKNKLAMLYKNDKDNTIELITPNEYGYAWIALYGYRLSIEQLKEYISVAETKSGRTTEEKDEKRKLLADAYKNLGLNDNVLNDDNTFKEVDSDINENIEVRIINKGELIADNKNNTGGIKLIGLKIKVFDEYTDSDSKREG